MDELTKETHGEGTPTVFYNCRLCGHSNVHRREDLAEMIRMAGFTLCEKCLGSYRFLKAEPSPGEEQFAPYPVPARELLRLPLQIFLFLKTRVELVDANRKADAERKAEFKQGPDVPARAAEPE